MGSIRIAVFGAAALLSAAHGVQAYTRHPSTPAEREQTRELNQQQMQLAERQNAGLAVNADSAATDASANMAANSPPIAAPTHAVQQANNLPQTSPAPTP